MIGGYECICFAAGKQQVCRAAGRDLRTVRYARAVLAAACRDERGLFRRDLRDARQSCRIGERHA